MWPESLTRSLEHKPIVAVLVVEDPAHAVPAARALVRGGVHHMELALRTERSIDALKAIVDGVPDMTAGVGTVLSPEQVRAVQDAGAAFAVSPGFNPRVVDAAEEIGLPFAPGIATPSEIEAAYAKGCVVQKLFPAEPLGGTGYLGSVNAAYRHLGLRFIPLGGVKRENMSGWLALPEVLAIGGSWLADKTLLAEERWDEIERRARDAMDAAMKENV